MKKNTQQSGFSLIELLVATALTIGLTGTIFSLLNQAQGAFLVEGAVADNTQNFRAAIDLISRDIQAAGAGLPGFLGPVAGTDGGVDASNNPLPDEILILFGTTSPGFPATIQTAISLTGPGAVLTVLNPLTGAAPVFTNGSDYVVYTTTQPQAIPTPGSAEFYVFTLDSQAMISGGTLLTPRTTPAVSLPAWSNLNFPLATTLQIAPLNQVVRYKVDSATKQLQLSVNSGNFVTVAENITNLQLSYLTEPVDNSTTPATLTSVSVDQVGTSNTNNRALIRSVQVTINARTAMGRVADRQGERTISETIQVTPRNLVLPGFVINR